MAYRKEGLTVSDVILVYFGLEPNHPIYSRKKLMLSIFRFYEELKKKGYKYIDPKFNASRSGPTSHEVSAELDKLIWSHFIQVQGQYNKPDEMFILTQKGKREAEGIIKERIRESDLNDLKLLRMSLDQYTDEGIKRYIRFNYPEFFEKERKSIKEYTKTF